mgnify:CR=1 FL=1
MNNTIYHESHDQFPFKNNPVLVTDNYRLYRDNRFTKEMINNRHHFKMTKYNNAGYGYQIFYGSHSVGSIWFLNQVAGGGTYIRVSRYESYAHNHFIAVLTELTDLFSSHGYSLILKTALPYAQGILNQNFYGKKSKASHGKRGKNDRSTKDVSVDGISYDLARHLDTYEKYHKTGIFDA